MPGSTGASDPAKNGMPPADETSPDGAPAGSRSRIRHSLSTGWHLAMVAYRDPEHVAERIALNSTQSLGEPSLEWAQRVRKEREGVPRAVIAEQLRTDSAKVAAIDGAVAGTPFLVALIPGYLVYLRQDARMLLRTAALYDRDPRDLETTAEMLALRGVHPTVDAARAALLAVRDAATAREADRAPPMAYVGPQRLRAADLRRVPLRAVRQEQGGGPSVGEDRDRGPVRCDRVGDYVGVPAQLHDRDWAGAATAIRETSDGER